MTYFFSGGREAPLAGEERCLVPSPKVATYDLEPAMSALGVTDEVVRRLAAGPPDLVVLNYANADMVGHTGVLAPTVARGRGARRLPRARRGRGARAPAACSRSPPTTATPSRCGTRRAASRTPRTRRTRCRSSSSARRPAGVRLEEGLLADVAPTLLDLLGLDAPAAMTGRSLLRR